MRKGQQTKALILNEAVAYASLVGFEGLSIGSLAGRLRLSKSGLFAHFGSKEDLQLQTLKRAQERFEEVVFTSALKLPRGLPRLRAIFSNWLGYLEAIAAGGGCPVLAAAAEYDDRPGSIRDMLLAGQRELRGALAKAVRLCIEEGHLRQDADAWQFAYEFFGIMLAAHHDRKLLDDSRAGQRAEVAFDRLLRDNALAG